MALSVDYHLYCGACERGVRKTNANTFLSLAFATRLMGIKQKGVIILPEPQYNFHCFIPLGPAAKPEF